MSAGALANTPAGQLIGSLTAETSCRQVMIEMMEGCIDALAQKQDTLGFED